SHSRTIPKRIRISGSTVTAPETVAVYANRSTAKPAWMTARLWALGRNAESIRLPGLERRGGGAAGGGDARGGTAAAGARGGGGRGGPQDHQGGQGAVRRAQILGSLPACQQESEAGQEGEEAEVVPGGESRVTAPEGRRAVVRGERRHHAQDVDGAVPIPQAP